MKISDHNNVYAVESEQYCNRIIGLIGNSGDEREQKPLTPAKTWISGFSVYFCALYTSKSSSHRRDNVKKNNSKLFLHKKGNTQVSKKKENERLKGTNIDDREIDRKKE